MHICISPPLMLWRTLSYDRYNCRTIKHYCFNMQNSAANTYIQEKEIKILETHRKEKTPLARCFPINKSFL